MNIGIIGSGNMGSLLAKHFIRTGHNVYLANSRGPQSLAALAAATGIVPVTVEQAVQDKDIVVLSLPQESVRNLPKDLFTRSGNNTIVVDAGNYYPEVRDARLTEIEGGLTESEWVSLQLGVPVIKAFNDLTVWSLATRALPRGTSGRVCLSVTGDNNKDKQTILALMDQVGFDGIDAGMLADSWRQQPGAPAYCGDLDKAGLMAALETAAYDKIDEYRKTAVYWATQAVEEAGSLAAAMANAGKPAGV